MDLIPYKILINFSSSGVQFKMFMQNITEMGLWSWKGGRSTDTWARCLFPCITSCMTEEIT